MKVHRIVCLGLACGLVFSCKSGPGSGTDTTPPGFPTGLSAARNGDAVELAWTMPPDSDLAGVLVLRRADVEPDTAPTTGQSYAVGDDIGYALVIYRGHTTSNTYIDTPPGMGRWCYRVFAFDTSYNYAGSASRCVDFMEDDTTPPTFGGLVSATGVSNTQIRLDWEAASDDVTAQGDIVYDVYQAEVETGISYTSPTYTTGGGATSLTVFGLSTGTTYWFVVRARDLAGNRDNNQLARSGTTLSSSDVTPPTFAGLTSATAVSGARIDLAWGAASDDTTAPGNIVYDVYVATVSGGQTFGTPSYSTSPGATSMPVIGLTANSTYYFVVRARDEAGNQDSNTVERSATTQASGDVTPPVFAGLATADAMSDTQILLTWADATDNVTSTANMVYLVYQSTTSGGHSFTTPTYTTSAGLTAYTVGGLTAGTTYYFVVRARDEAGNNDTNTVQRSATTASGADTTPPNFTGVISATAVSSSAIDLTWNAAVDDVTPAAGIVYDIYYATSSGGQSFAVPNVSTPPGELTHRVTGLQASTTYYFVVRARDASGNRDVNLVERNATTHVTDTTPPIIVSDNFTTGGALVSGTTGFVASVTFSELVTGVNATNVTIDNGASIGSFATSDNVSWNFTASGLQDGTRYTVTFSSGIKDESLNSLSSTTREIYVAASVLYVRPGGAGLNDGTSPANALPLVSQALYLAAPGTDIYVQGGTYNDSITLVEGVNIYGGYDPSFTVRDPVNNESLLTQSAFDTTVIATGSGLTRNTVIDGMAFTNTISGTRAVLRISQGAGITVRGSRLFLGAAGCYDQSVVDGTSGTGNALVLERSIVSSGGMGTGSCTRATHGVLFSSADSYVRLDGNTISDGPVGSTSTSYYYYFYAVQMAAHTCEIVNNVIDGGGTGSPSTRRSYGVFFAMNTAYRKLVIANNTLSGGAGYNRYAIYLSGAINSLHDVRIGNNVLFNDSGGSTSYAIYRTSATGIITRVENNMLTSAGVYLYSGGNYTTISSMETYLTGVGTVASLNKEVATIGDLYFENYPTRDWRPTSQSPMSLTHGGRDTSAEEWGSVTTDRLGNPRTSLYSIGAYEYE